MHQKNNPEVKKCWTEVEEEGECDRALERVQCGQRQREKTWWTEMLGEDRADRCVDTGQGRGHYG